MARKEDRPIPTPECIRGIDGMLHRKEANFLFNTPTRLGDGLYGDVGTHRGRSAACVAGGIIDSGVKGHVITVDSYVQRSAKERVLSVPEFVQTIRDDLEGRVMGSYITLVAANSAEVAADYKDKEFNFVFIDADHSYEACKADFEAWSPLVRSGGEVAFHDSNQPQIHMVIDESGWKVTHTVKSLKVIKKP